MSSFSCPVVRVAEVIDHPNADRLSLVRLDGLGYLCISAKLEDGSPRYKAGDMVVYIPSSAVLPEWLLRKMDFWNADTGKGMLAGSTGDRVKPLKLRGIFSEGVLYPVDAHIFQDLSLHDMPTIPQHMVGWPDMKPRREPTGVWNWKFSIVLEDGSRQQVIRGDDVSEYLGITKYSPPVPVHMAGEVASLAEAAFKYDFERIESVPDLFGPNEPVSVTEKLHGTCCIIQYFPDMDHAEMFADHAGYRSITVSSKGLGAQGLVFKDNDANAGNLYVRTLRRLLADYDLGGLMHAMSKQNGGCHPVAILGEVFGKGVQDLDYGTTKPEFRVFDMKIGNTWLDQYGINHWCRDLPQVPVLYHGPFDLAALEAVRDGKTTVGGDNIREGIVVRGVSPEKHPVHGRRIAKMISPDYLLRKVKGGEATEYT